MIKWAQIVWSWNIFQNIQACPIAISNKTQKMKRQLLHLFTVQVKIIALTFSVCIFIAAFRCYVEYGIANVDAIDVHYYWFDGTPDERFHPMATGACGRIFSPFAVLYSFFFKICLMVYPIQFSLAFIFKRSIYGKVRKFIQWSTTLWPLYFR